MTARATSFASIAFLSSAVLASAQNLVISNARIVVGNGTVVPNGAVVVRDGRIVSAGPAAPAGAQGQRIDAGGMTIMPGFIDAHRHIINGNDEQWFREQAPIRMREFLEAGYTTLMSGGGPVPGIIRLKERVEAGQLIGPRIITSGRVDPPNFKTPEAARAQVQAMAKAGVETNYLPREGLKHELRALSLMFSPQDVVKIMGPNSAAFLDRGADLGTLEPGKLADLVLVDGDPLDVIYNVLNVRMTIKGGRIVHDALKTAQTR